MNSITRAMATGDVVCLGSFSTRGLSKKEMFEKIKERELIGPWCPNIFDRVVFRPSAGVNFRLVAVCKPNDFDESWERLTADTLAFDFGFGNILPTFEMAYYLWERSLSSMRLNDQKPDLSCLIVCHQEIYCGKDVCDRVAVISDKMVVSGGISGPGHHFGDKAGYVYVLPE